MAQNITLLGASYSDVPAVTLPKTGGGTATFTDVTDTTAAASDVASGKYFYTDAGVRTEGTASGGGGASNFVHGTFTTPSTVGVYEVDIPYSGTGYPIAAVFVIKGGAYTPDTEWYTRVRRYNVGFWAMVKASINTAPDYSANANNNMASVSYVYKNSTSSATTYAGGGGASPLTYTSSIAPTDSGILLLKFKSNTKFAVRAAENSFCFPCGFEYEYFITYSS